MNIGKWALSNSKLVYFFIAILVGGGIFSYDRMSKLEDPEIKVKQAMVVTTCPGASPYEIELQVTDPLEKAIRSMKGVNKVESRSSGDLSIISISLLTTIPDSETEQYWDILRRKISDVQSKLPKECNSSLVIDDYGDVYGMFYALTSQGFDNKELSRYAELIKREVQNIEGISKVELYGVTQPVINISIYEDKMASLGVSPAEVLQTIQGQNKTIYSGYYGSGDSRMRVSVSDKYRDTKDIENLIIQGHENDQMRLGDIAKVDKNFAAPVRNQMFYDRHPAIGISISTLSGTDITKMGKLVDSKLRELHKSRLPAGIEINKVFFQPERVDDAIGTFIINLIESVAIVILILMFTMGFRSGVLLGITLIITVLGSLLFLDAFGGTMQRVSLGSFILTMGMLVDNAIVIVDGILVDLGKGRLRRRALTDIGKKTAMPLLGATLVAILAFFPIFLSPDTAGVYVRDLFIVLAVSLFLSWVLSLTIVPIQAKRMLKSPEIKKEQFNNRFYRILRDTLTWGLRHRSVTLTSALILIAVSIYCYKLLPQSFFPDMSYDQLYIEYKLPEGTTSNKTRADIESITDYLLSQKNITHVTSSIGGTPSRYNLVRSIATPSLSYGELIVDFKSNKELVNSITGLQKYLSEQYPQAYVRVKRYNLMYNKYPIEAMFTGPDPAVLADLTRKAQQIMEKSSKIYLVTSDWEAKVPVLDINYNQAIARNIGLSRSDVGLSLLASTDGIPAATVYDGNIGESIVVKCVDKDGKPIETLESAPVFSLLPSVKGLDKKTIQGLMTGAVSEEDILASALATTPLRQTINGIKLRWEDPVVIRYNGERAMRAEANNIPSVGAEDARAEILKEVEAIPLPDGYSLSWQGEYKAKNQSLKYLFANLPLAIVLMIGILIMLFKDYRKPLIIMLCVPLLLVGVVFGVLLSGKAFGFVAICGILGLIGMMIKNGVVLMDEINLQIASGVEPVKALLDSSAIRFRPVMMASMTTIVGMIPLQPDDMFGSLAATIMGGLLVGTLITLIFIPIVYSIFFKIKIKQ
jgi:multidrug efflux pump subunit AcrB